MENTNLVKVMKKITGMLDVLICLLLFISSIYKGGFYKEDSLFISMVICILGLVCLSVKLFLNIKDNKKITKSKIGTLIDILMILLPIVYFLPVVFKTYASLESAIFESIRYVNLAIIYFIVRTTTNKKIYLNSIVVIGIMLAIMGIDELSYRGIEKLFSNLSVNYLENSNGRLSSTIQYANITGLIILMASIICQNKLVNSLVRLKKEKNNLYNMKLAVELFIVILLQSSVILTTSRMNILLMIVITITTSMYYWKTLSKHSGSSLLLLLLASFLLVSSIDNYLMLKSSFMVIFTYFITLILCVIFAVANSFAKCGKIGLISYNQKYKILGSKWMKALLTLFGVIAIYVVIFTPQSLKASDSTGNEYIVSRNIYVDLKENTDLKLKLDVREGNDYQILIYEIDGNFNKKINIAIGPDKVKDGIYERNIKIDKNTKRLQVCLKVINSSVSITSFKLNDEEITLSYMFVPDTILFKIKDTIKMDSNNNLRKTYYMDALKLVKKSPIIGIGGEGFKNRYQEVQEEAYVSSEVHSVPLQILVEAGLIGLITYLSIIFFTIVIVILFIKSSDKKQEGISYLLLFGSLIITSLFDLVFSFEIMMYLFAIIIALIVGEYKKGNIGVKDKYILDNKSPIGMIKIATLSISLMMLVISTYYSINIYRASMLIIKTSDENTLYNSYEQVGILENKVKLDAYNTAYLSNLLDEYDNHIKLLNDIYLSADTGQKQVVKSDIDNYMKSQKQVADNLIEYEYYNKYVLEKVARNYFERYISYAKLYSYMFKNDEIAYTFYIGYAIKLTERIIQVGPVNKVAHQFAKDIYEEYIPKLERQNKIVQSPMLQSAIDDMKNKLNDLK